MLQIANKRVVSSCKPGHSGALVRPARIAHQKARQGVLTYAQGPESSSGGQGQTKVEDLPPWVRREKERELQAQEAAKGNTRFPWGLALLGSVLVAIAATGSIFEFVDRNPIFGVIQPDSPAWAPILLFMGVTGYPTAGFLFKYGVDGFNEMAEMQDRMDGYLPDDRK